MDADLARAQHWLDVRRPERCLEALTAVEPNDPDVYQMRVRALLMLDRPADAIDIARSGLGAFPDDRDLMYLLSHGLAMTGKGLEAENVLLSALSRYPDDVFLLVELAELITSTLHFDRADRLLTRAAELAPESIEVDTARARWCIAVGKKKDARVWVERALAKDPEDVGALHLAGMVSLQEGKARAGNERLRSAALQQMDSKRLVSAARGSTILARAPWRYFMPGLRVSWIVHTVVGVFAFFVGVATVNGGNPVVGWSILGAWGALALYSAVGWAMVYVLVD